MRPNGCAATVWNGCSDSCWSPKDCSNAMQSPIRLFFGCWGGSWFLVSSLRSVNNFHKVWVKINIDGINQSIANDKSNLLFLAIIRPGLYLPHNLFFLLNLLN